MSTYRTHWRIVSSLPDGHIVLIDMSETTSNGTPILRADHLAAHIRQPLVDDLNEMFRHLERSRRAHRTFEIQLEHRGEPPQTDAWYERVDPDHLPLRTMGLRTGTGSDGRLFTTFYVRADMMSAALCTELNDYTIPENMGVLREVAEQNGEIPLTDHAERAVDLHSVTGGVQPSRTSRSWVTASTSTSTSRSSTSSAPGTR